MYTNQSITAMSMLTANKLSTMTKTRPRTIGYKGRENEDILMPISELKVQKKKKKSPTDEAEFSGFLNARSFNIYSTRHTEHTFQVGNKI